MNEYFYISDNPVHNEFHKTSCNPPPPKKRKGNLLLRNVILCIFMNFLIAFSVQHFSDRIICSLQYSRYFQSKMISSRKELI